jgi:hypothetical protein
VNESSNSAHPHKYSAGGKVQPGFVRSLNDQTNLLRALRLMASSAKCFERG